MFGYTNSTEYYKDICLSRCLKETKTFTICVNADDDPCYSKEVSFDLDLIVYYFCIPAINFNNRDHNCFRYYSGEMISTPRFHMVHSGLNTIFNYFFKYRFKSLSNSISWNCFLTVFLPFLPLHIDHQYHNENWKVVNCKILTNTFFQLFPVDVVKENPNVCLISTAAGGHFGFAGLGWPFHRITFTDKLISQIVAMIHSQLK